MDTQHPNPISLDINSIPEMQQEICSLDPQSGKKDRIFTIIGEDPILVGQSLEFKKYYITAFDDTPGPDGGRDESALVEAKP